jgi:two-component system chemotaxis sensor kinase CheA
VRDLARDLGKLVRLDVRGGDIELDRSVLDALGDPLVHLLRNAIDHGIERPEERGAAGKPVEGVIRLSAERTRGEVAIRVEDDGRGIDRGAVRERALRLGLVDPDDPPPDDPQLLRLLAHSGFTLKAQVTAISGRGVGVDAVLARIRALGGRMELMTAAGKGTTFLVTLPLTRAIVRALLVEADGQRYAIPYGVLTEAAMAEQQDGSVSLRGEALPSADLSRVVGGAGRDGGHRPMVVLDAGGRRGALLVDALLGQQDVVVEQFVAPAGIPPWINGATILPDGAPALILDPTALF